MSRLLVLLAMLLVSAVAWAKEAPPAAADPAIEARMLALASQLRCLVCQNESLAASNADLAADLREEIREMMRQGKSDKQIVAFLVARYGDFVLYKPPLMASTVLLWFGPLLLLLAGGYALFRRIRRRSGAPGPELSAAERARAARLLESPGDPETP
ncbi:MAG: cytochrome c-type biogenesis protein CcmH [Betaproteobacteria bacterium]|nr:cytochrome c-type biogenesis protein CcmH [Betaproteobacteria bacterium]